MAGNCDVLATRGSQSVAVEIETGKSNIVSNIVRNVLPGIPMLVVVATSEESYASIQRLLVRQGLLIHDRIDLVLRDEFGDVFAGT